MTNVKQILLVAVSAMAVACGGGTPAPTTPDPGTTDEPVPEPTKDLIFEYEAETLQGMRFKPQALGVPGMWKISTPKRATLKKQRKIAAKKKATASDMQVLAALAWSEASTKLAAARKEPDAGKKTKLESEAQALREEARTALRKAYTNAGEGKADEVTLKLLSVAEITLGDTEAATKAYTEIVSRFPGEPASNPHIWLAHLHLQADRLSEAAAVSKDWQLAPETNPMAAYVWAWIKFRQRDFPAAVKGISFAATNWRSKAGRRAVSNDLLLFLSRAGTPVAESQKIIVGLLGESNKADHYRWMYNLSKGYEFSGYPGLAGETLNLLLGGTVSEVSPRDQVVFRAEAAYDALKAGNPGATGELAITAHKKLADCGEACQTAAANVTTALQTYATLLHTLYAHSMDEAYYTPAKAMYDYYLAIPNAPNAAQIKDYASRLADTKANATAGQGVHDKGETQKLVKLRLNSVKACYESVLQSEPALAGQVKLTLNIDPTGAVTGAETEPAKGAEGLAAVAGCIDARARTWKFPGRTLKGTTAVVQPFNLSPAPAK